MMLLAIVLLCAFLIGLSFSQHSYNATLVGYQNFSILGDYNASLVGYEEYSYEKVSDYSTVLVGYEEYSPKSVADYSTILLGYQEYSPSAVSDYSTTFLYSEAIGPLYLTQKEIIIPKTRCIDLNKSFSLYIATHYNINKVTWESQEITYNVLGEYAVNISGNPIIFNLYKVIIDNINPNVASANVCINYTAYNQTNITFYKTKCFLVNLK